MGVRVEMSRPSIKNADLAISHSEFRVQTNGVFVEVVFQVVSFFTLSPRCSQMEAIVG